MNVATDIQKISVTALCSVYVCVNAIRVLMIEQRSSLWWCVTLFLSLSLPPSLSIILPLYVWFLASSFVVLFILKTFFLIFIWSSVIAKTSERSHTFVLLKTDKRDFLSLFLFTSVR